MFFFRIGEALPHLGSHLGNLPSWKAQCGSAVTGLPKGGDQAVSLPLLRPHRHPETRGGKKTNIGRK